MGKVKDFAMTHAECPVCGRCFLPWESGSLQFCGHPECNDERDQLFEEIADQSKEDCDGRRSSNGEVDRTGSLGSEEITTRKASGNARKDAE